MGKYQFLIDTGDYCFLCFSKQTSWDQGENVKKVERNTRKAFSFRNICQYLATNLREVFGDAIPLSSSTLPILEQSEVKGTLCVECAHLHELFSEHFLELEVIQMKLQSYLKSICDRMMNAERNNDGVLEEFRAGMLSRPETIPHYGIVERLRSRTLEQCSKLTETVIPRLVLKKVEIPKTSIAATTNFLITPIITSVKGCYADSSNPLSASAPIIHEIVKEEDRKCEQLLSPHVIEQTAAATPQNMSSEINDPSQSSPITMGNYKEACIKVPETDKFGCKLCSKEFTAFSSFKSHYNSVHLNLEFKCHLCTSTFTRIYTLRQHQQSFHFGNRYQCNYCRCLFTTSNKRNAHSKYHCSLRNNRALAKGNQNRVISFTSASSDNSVKLESFECEVCNKTFATSTARLDHQMKMHSERQFQCEFCNIWHSKYNHKQYCPTRPAESSTWNTIPEGRTPYTIIKEKVKCGLCEKSFAHKITLSNHQRSVHFGRRFKCRFCPKCFTNSGSQYRHMRSCKLKERHGTTTSSSRSSEHQNIPNTALGREFSCDFCPTKFAHSSSRNRHMTACPRRPQHDDGEGLQRLYSTLPVIETLDPLETFILPDADNDPEQNREEIGVNLMEGDEPPDNSSLIKEMPSSCSLSIRGNPHGGMSIIPEGSSYRCSVCPMEFVTQTELEVHYKRTHSKKEYNCHLCGIEFYQMNSYYNHRRNVHMGIMYKCDLCGKDFTRNTSLTKHKQNVHFGKRSNNNSMHIS